MTLEDFISLEISPNLSTAAPLGYGAYLVAIHARRVAMPRWERLEYEDREEALRRARNRDTVLGKKRRDAGAPIIHVSHVWTEGEEAALRREFGLPPRLVRDMGGYGTAARLEFLLGVKHLDHCFAHPLCETHFDLASEEVQKGIELLGELRALCFGGQLRATIWTRLVNPYTLIPYLGVNEPRWKPTSAFAEFFGTKCPRDFLAGYRAGYEKIQHEIERSLRWESVKAQVYDMPLRRAIESLYGLPSLRAIDPGELWKAERSRVQHILLDGFPARFQKLRTARAVLAFVDGILIEPDRTEDYFIRELEADNEPTL